MRRPIANQQFFQLGPLQPVGIDKEEESRTAKGVKQEKKVTFLFFKNINFVS